MYVPAAFKEDRPEILRAFIAAHPLGTLITSNAGHELGADHIPMLWSAQRDTPHGVLHGHVARANPVCREVAADSAVLVIFGGASRYITPSWYPGKAEHGKVVPTWNYAVVHARGAIRFFTEDREHSLRHLNALTNVQEARSPKPWRVSDAPVEFIDGMLPGVVAFEIRLTALLGKFKSSQNRSERDRAGVAAGLEAAGIDAADRAELLRAPQS